MVGQQMTDDTFEQLVRRAEHLFEQDTQLMNALVARRKEIGLSQKDVAERLGWEQADVRDFEVYWYDPPLSEIRRYALVVDMQVDHVTTELETVSHGS